MSLYELFRTFCPSFTRDAQLFSLTELGTAVFRFLAETNPRDFVLLLAFK